MVKFGTKCPSMTSTWSQSDDAATSPTCSARAPKSAERTDGAIRTSPTGPGSRCGREGWVGISFGVATGGESESGIASALKYLVARCPAAQMSRRSLSRRSTESSPAQDAPEAVEVGLSLAEFLQQ